MISIIASTTPIPRAVPFGLARKVFALLLHNPRYVVFICQGRPRNIQILSAILESKCPFKSLRNVSVSTVLSLLLAETPHRNSLSSNSTNHRNPMLTKLLSVDKPPPSIGMNLGSKPLLIYSASIRIDIFLSHHALSRTVERGYFFQCGQSSGHGVWSNPTRACDYSDGRCD